MKYDRGVAIEYVLITMALVAVLVVAVLTSASLTGQISSRYRNYAEQKMFLDSSAEEWLSCLEERGSLDGLADRLEDNSYGYKFTLSQNSLFATRDRLVIFYVEAERREGDLVVTAWRYGI